MTCPKNTDVSRHGGPKYKHIYPPKKTQLYTETTSSLKSPNKLYYEKIKQACIVDNVNPTPIIKYTVGKKLSLTPVIRKS